MEPGSVRASDPGAAPREPSAPGRSDRDPLSTSPGRRWWQPVWRPLLMVAVGLGLWWGYASTGDFRPQAGWFDRPPIYGGWQPVPLANIGWLVSASVLLAGVGLLVVCWLRVWAWLALTLLVAAGTAAAAAVTVTRGDPAELIRGVDTGPKSLYYTVDIHLVAERGVRAFTRLYPHLHEEFRSFNSRTHPPGVLVLLELLHRATGGRPLVLSTVLAVLGMTAAVPAYLLGRELGGERAGRIAALLLVAAPGPLLLAYTCLDTLFAGLLAGSAALVTLATVRRSWVPAAAAGALLGVTAYVTYAFAFIALAAALAVPLALRSVRESLRLLGSAAAAGLVVLVAERVVLGYDLWACYSSVPGRPGADYEPYWVVAGPLAVLIFAGLPLAALGIAGLLSRAPNGHRSLMPILVVLVMVVWGALPFTTTKLRPGEVERTWAFLYPLLAGCAGVQVERWTGHRLRWAVPVLIVLVALGVILATMIQIHYNTVF